MKSPSPIATTNCGTFISFTTFTHPFFFGHSDDSYFLKLIQKNAFTEEAVPPDESVTPKQHPDATRRPRNFE
jgi:hypothetical protein